MSDAQAVTSHALRPSLIDPVWLASPNLAPCTLKLVDPVPAALARRSTLPMGMPTLYPALPLPARKPAVSERKRLWNRPWPVRHRVDVSDSHAVPSQAVRPALTPHEYPESPIPDPMTVTLLDPDAATFLRLAVLTDPRSVECPTDTLPIRTPDVITARLLPLVPPLARQRTLVSDCHPDASHELRPSLAISHIVLGPRLDPCTVTLVAPVTPRFVLRFALILSESTLKDLVTLPERRPTVIDRRLLPTVPCTDWQSTDVSDPQDDRSHAVCPSRIEPLSNAHPIPPPSKVTLTPPVAATFIRAMTLPGLKSVECPIVMLPTCRPAVTCVRLLPITLCPA